MVTKELIDARWKAIVCGLLALVLVVISAATYDLFKTMLSGSSSQVPQFLQQQLQQFLGSYDHYVWGNWFAKNGAEILAVLAAILGATLVAGEVSKGTIFFLLSKPISRERVLLTKYAVSACLLLAVTILSSVALLVTAALVGHPQPIAGVGSALLDAVQGCDATSAAGALRHHPARPPWLLPELGLMEPAHVLVQPGGLSGPGVSGQGAHRLPCWSGTAARPDARAVSGELHMSAMRRSSVLFLILTGV